MVKACFFRYVIITSWLITAELRALCERPIVSRAIITIIIYWAVKLMRRMPIAKHIYSICACERFCWLQTWKLCSLFSLCSSWKAKSFLRSRNNGWNCFGFWMFRSCASIKGKFIPFEIDFTEKEKKRENNEIRFINLWTCRKNLLPFHPSARMISLLTIN